MKKISLIVSVLAIAVAGSIFLCSQWKNDIEQQYTPRQQKEFTKKVYGPKEALTYLQSLRANQYTGTVDIRDVILARMAVEKKATNSRGNLAWKEMGPDNVGGRTRAILIDKNNPNTVYAGGAGGGLWKSTTGGTSWVRVNYSGDNGRFPCLAISCITQASNGDIYFGTGEGHANAAGMANGSTGFIGTGIWKSTDGTTFSQLTATIPATSNSEAAEWAYVNNLGASPTSSGTIYAATNRGLRMTTDGGTTWTNPVFYPTQYVQYISPSADVDVATDGTVIAAIGDNCFRSNDGTTGWTKVGANLPATNEISRIEFAFAPSDPNYVYCAAANNSGHLYNVYKSTDKGSNWTVIGPGGSPSFPIFSHVANNVLSGGQGSYDNTVAVFPDNKDKILVGGIDMWLYNEPVGWSNKSCWAYSHDSPYYIHADHHTYKFHPTNPLIIYAGTDGGVHRSMDGGNTWQVMNRGYNVTQFYTVAMAANGCVMGGTQDNGTLYNDLQGTSDSNFVEVRGGDGAYCDFSLINPKVLFASVYSGDIRRSPDYGESFSEDATETDGTTTTTFNAFLGPVLGNLAAPKPANFICPFEFWECFNNPNSTDTITFVNREDYTIYAGQTIRVLSRNGTYPFDYILSETLEPGDTARIKDIIASKFYIGFSGEVWFTKDALDFSVVPSWYKIATLSGQLPQCMALSGDGDVLYVGTTNGRVYRITDLLSLENATAAAYCNANNVDLVFSASQVVTSVAVDQDDANKVVVTLGNYGNNNYVYFSGNAMATTPSFTQRQGDLPKMPVYGSIV
ncbi:MAG: hypothetical protein KKA07_18255, partial [Bacteroidetes bacterium]|nr:hypothetical protein [Bacteroidota bacterium]